MKPRVIVIDYGLGNLLSVKRALEYCGADNILVTGNPEEICNADQIILPGVGAFSDGMRGLEERGLINAIHRHVEKGRPLLGICLGMQMLASQSEEFGLHSGLNLIPGQVIPIQRNRKDESIRKIPYVGWAHLIPKSEKWTQSILNELNKNDSVYFVHSYQVVAESNEDVIAVYDFEGIEITAIIQRNNVIGVQFHPEKSGTIGLNIIKKFLKT